MIDEYLDDIIERWDIHRLHNDRWVTQSLNFWVRSYIIIGRIKNHEDIVPVLSEAGYIPVEYR